MAWYSINNIEVCIESDFKKILLALMNCKYLSLILTMMKQHSLMVSYNIDLNFECFPVEYCIIQVQKCNNILKKADRHE